jgi:outer membrane autotransporter protein
LPRRDRDETIAGFAWAPAQQDEGASFGMVLEAGYRFRFSGWGWIQPYAQYLVQPAGTPDVANATVLGVQAGIDF